MSMHCPLALYVQAALGVAVLGSDAELLFVLTGLGMVVSMSLTQIPHFHVSCMSS